VRILVFNAGSSSLKFGYFEIAPGGPETHALKATADRFANSRAHLVLTLGATRQEREIEADGIAGAIAAVPGLIAECGLPAPDVIGHRIAHGGDRFRGPARLDPATLAVIDRLTPLAPLHNPANLEAVRLAASVWPDLPQLGVFDTAFHLDAPDHATTYAVPAEWRAAGLRRYGFHGTSHRYVALRAAEALGEPPEALRIVSLHLGNGASACAINRGRSMDSSMGLTPIEGLVMGTRSGDVDPGAFGYLARTLGLDIDRIEAALYSDSGLKALCGHSDMREIEAEAAAGDPSAQLAIEITAYRARKYVGAYAAAMGGMDALVFTGGIGENSPSMRRRICDGLDFLGLRIDPDRNAAPDLSDRAAPQVQAWGSRVAVIVTETAEQLQIAREVAGFLAPRATAGPQPLPVAVSGRHVHLSTADVEALFGPGRGLTPERPLRQPGNYAAAETVTVEGPRGRLQHVRVLGPPRKRTQIEVSRTDSFALGLAVPVRQSGDLEGTPRVRLIGPAGSLETDGLIVAARHIHISPEDAERRGLTDGQSVAVELGQGGRGLTFSGVLVRVQPEAFTEMHIDTDEANAAGLGPLCEGQLIAGAARVQPHP
jgi:acetate kinase